MYKKINNKKKSNQGSKKDDANKEKQHSKDENNKPEPASKGKASRNRPRDDELKSIQFASGNSSIEVTNGIIYHFVESDFQKCEEKGHKSELILMLQVPISFTTQELLQFTGPVSQTVEQIRIIRDCKPTNQYMALIKFKNQMSADEFFTNFNGVQFNSIEPDICRLVYVEKIELINNDDSKSNGDLVKTELSMVGEQSTCTFCLENMNDFKENNECKESKDQENANAEQNDAILTVLCGHSFHSNCLMKWPGALKYSQCLR